MAMVMASEWVFLEPWRVVMLELVTEENTSSADSSVEVTFYLEYHPMLQRQFPISISVHEGSRRDTARLQRIRETMELFTLLSLVDNKAFTEIVFSLTGIHQSRIENHNTYCPEWTFKLIGTLSPNDVAGVETGVTWGALLGFLDDPWEYSHEFRDAARRLEAMGMDETSQTRAQSESAVSWTCRLQDSRASGEQILGKSADASSSFRGRLGGLFDVVVPAVVHVCTIRGYAASANTSIPACSPRLVDAWITNWAQPSVPEFTSALVRTPMSLLGLRLENGAMNSRQEVVNAGIMLSRLLCSYRSGTSCTIPDTIRPEYNRLHLTCLWLADRLFIAISSAVAEAHVDANLRLWWMSLDGSERWPWLVYALCCGTSDVLVPSVDISRGTLTKSDISVICAVLQANYPQRILGEGHHQYGIVDIREGAKVHFAHVNHDGSGDFILPRAFRCRALYEPDNSEWISIIVPGYGACKTKRDGNVRFTPDSGKADARVKRLSASLTIKYLTFESPEVLTDLLRLVTCGLRSLTLCADDEDPATTAIPVDLCTLAAACPELQKLSITDLYVVVSAHDNSLCQWPIKALWLHGHPGTLSDLIGCLRDPSLRMARQLLKLEVTARRHQYDKHEMKELKAHDGEILPVVKEKVPASSKAAMVSVVTAAVSATKPVQRLDAHILSLIFVFASTPEQRSIVCSCRARRN